MEVLTERACGVDVHQGMLMCTALTGAGTRPTREVVRFGTMTDELKRLRQWLLDREITHVGMEGTGVYWMPLYELLEGDLEVIVGNARHIKNVPGRKTDVKDSAWIADLVRHGLIAKSFIPAKPFREIRYLTRYRTSLINARTSDRNRLLKLLESMNIKLASVVSDVFGVSGMAMLRALAKGEMTPEQVAQLAKGRLRSKEQDLRRALVGTLGERQRLILRTQLCRLDDAEGHLKEINQQIRERVAPYQKELDWLTTIPGVDFVVASTIIGELGTDLSSFRDAGALSNWVGLAPGANESAGKRKSAHILPGNRYLKPMLVEAAQSLSRAKAGYLREKFWKLRGRMDHNCAAVAVAHKLIIAVYHILTRREPYKDLGADYLAKQDAKRILRSISQRAAKLGYQVQFAPLAQPTPAVAHLVPPTPEATISAAPSASSPKVRLYTLRPFIGAPEVQATSATSACPGVPEAPRRVPVRKQKRPDAKREVAKEPAEKKVATKRSTPRRRAAAARPNQATGKSRRR